MNHALECVRVRNCVEFLVQFMTIVYLQQKIINISSYFKKLKISSYACLHIHIYYHFKVS